MIFLLIALLSACGMENRAGKNASEISEKPVVSPAGEDSTVDMNEPANEAFDIPSIFDEDPFLQAKDAASRPYAKPSDPKEIDSGCRQEIETLIKAFFDAYNSSLNARSDADLSVFYDLSTNNRVWDFRLNQAVKSGVKPLFCFVIILIYKRRCIFRFPAPRLWIQDPCPSAQAAYPPPHTAYRCRRRS